MGGCGSKGVAVGSDGHDTADSAASLTGRPPSSASGVSPSPGSQMRAAAKTAWQTSARNLRNSLTRSRRPQESSHGRSNKNITSSDVDEGEIDSAGRAGRLDGHDKRKAPASAAPAGGSVAWLPGSSELRQQSGQRGRYLTDTAKVEGASSVEEPGGDVDAGDSYVRSFHVRNQATDSLDEAEDAEVPCRKESSPKPMEGSLRPRKVAIGSLSASSGVLLPSSALSPAAGAATSEGWAVSGLSRVPLSSSPAGVDGPLTGISPPTSGAAGRQSLVEVGSVGGGGGGWTAPSSVPSAAPATVAALPAAPTGGEPAAGSQAVQPPAAAGAGVAGAPDAAAFSTLPTAPAEPVQWVIRPGPPVESAYVLGEVLGKGSFGVVRTATHVATGAKVAVKTIRKSLLAAADVSALRREVEILHHLLGHPNISQLLGVYEEPSQLHLVLELYQGGDLFDAIIAVGRHSEKAAADVMRTVLSTISYCHAMGVAHRDIKPENFMLTAPLPSHVEAVVGLGGSQNLQDETVGGRGASEETMGSKLKLIDFGLSVFCSDSHPLTDTVGTSYYVAPEVLAKSYNRSADVWSAGVILHILLTGYAPFDGRNDQEILKAVQMGKLDLTTDPIWTSISRDATAVLTAMLNRDPAQRATADQVLAMPWLGRTAASSTAATTPLPGVVSERMRRFARMNSFKKEARRVVAGLMRPEEVAGLVEQFKALDADGDGKLNVHELRDGLARQELQSRSATPGAAGGAPALGPLQEDELRELVQRSDLNGDGLLDQSEFLGAALPTAVISRQAQQAFGASTLARPGSRTNALAAAFAHFDADGSGFITQDELRSALAAHHPESQGPDIRALLSRVDRDADGRISYPEFVDMLVQEVDEQEEFGDSSAVTGPKRRGAAATTAAVAAANSCSEVGAPAAHGGRAAAAAPQPYLPPRQAQGHTQAERLYPLDAASKVRQHQGGRGRGSSGGGASGGGAAAAVAAVAAAKRRIQVASAWGVGPGHGAGRGRNGQNHTTSFKSTAVQSGGSGRLSSFDWCDECKSRGDTSGEGDDGGWMREEASTAVPTAYGSSGSSSGQSPARGPAGGGGGGYIPSRLSPAAHGGAHEGLYRAAEAAALTLLGSGPGGGSSLLGQMSVGGASGGGGAGAAASAWDSTSGRADPASNRSHAANRPPAILIPPSPAAARRARRHSAAEMLGDGCDYEYSNNSRAEDNGSGRGGGGGGARVRASGASVDGRFSIAMEHANRPPRMSEGQVLNAQHHRGQHPHAQLFNGPRQHGAMYPGVMTHPRGNVGPSPLGGHRTRHRQLGNGMTEKGYSPGTSPAQHGGFARADMPTAVQNARGRVGGGNGIGVSVPAEHHLAIVDYCNGRQRGGALQPRGPYPPIDLYDGPSAGGSSGSGGGGRTGQHARRSVEAGYSDQPLAKMGVAALPDEPAVLPPGACGEECSGEQVAAGRNGRFLAVEPLQQHQQHRQQQQLSPSQESYSISPLGPGGYSNYRGGGGGGGSSSVYSEPLPRLTVGNMRASMRPQPAACNEPGTARGASGGDGGGRGLGNSPLGDGMSLGSVMPLWEEEELS